MYGLASLTPSYDRWSSALLGLRCWLEDVQSPEFGGNFAARPRHATRANTGLEPPQKTRGSSLSRSADPERARSHELRRAEPKSKDGRRFQAIAYATALSACLRRSHFYLGMSMLVLVPVVYGFSLTVGGHLLHPTIPRPPILYIHAAVFSLWLALFISQSALVRMRRVHWHRRLGWFGAALGATVLVLGVTTAVVMARFNTQTLHATDAEAGLILPFFDMLCFATALTLGIWWRTRPERHRRLMLIATCVLTVAGFARFPSHILPSNLSYAGVDTLIFIGVARDAFVFRRVDPVYGGALPALIVGQVIAMYIASHNVSTWLTIAHAILW
jgi:hypothetical protein